MALATGPLVFSTFVFLYQAKKVSLYEKENFLILKKCYVHNIFTINLLS